MVKKLIGNAVALFLVSGLFWGCAVVDPPKDEPAGGSSDLTNLVVTEIMYHSYESSSGADSEEDEPYNFIEFHNKGTGDISLEGIEADGVDFKFQDGAKIKAGEYLVIASNKAKFEERYGTAPFGVYGKKLKNSGERLAFKDNSGKEFIVINYQSTEPWPIEADGEGYSIVPVSEATYSDYSNGALWRKSFALHGSPAKADPAPVYINEIIAHTDVKQGDAIELYNPNNIEVDITGWYLSDDPMNPKFKIPSGDGKIPADSFKVFYSSDFDNTSSPTAFGLSENGETVYLFDAGKQIVDSIAFEATDNEVSFGRCKNSAGRFVHAMLEKSTLGSSNSGPLLSSTLVITEIMYNPMPETKPEYIEIKNISDKTVDLWYTNATADTTDTTKTWKIGGFKAKFPQGTSVKAGEIIIVTNNTVTEANFRAAYTGVPDDVRIFCIGETALSNGGERIAIMASVRPNPEDPSKSYHKEIDVVEYRDEGLWSDLADGQGASLVRKDVKAFANDPTNWKAAPAPNPGVDER
ncbi:MAG: lamin tail domain-containing protein [Fibrobacter sp.]|nr:lamin tail domain-containing protein [Fibrobacter sp.]